MLFSLFLEGLSDLMEFFKQQEFKVLSHFFELNFILINFILTLFRNIRLVIIKLIYNFLHDLEESLITVSSNLFEIILYQYDWSKS